MRPVGGSNLPSPTGIDPVSATVTDLDEARRVGGAAYYPHRLRCAGRSSAFAMRLRSMTVDPLMVGVLGYDVEVHIETTGALGTAYEVNVPLGRPMDCWVGGSHAAGAPDRAVVSGPESTSTLHGFGRGNPLFGLKVERRALEAQYAVLHGRPPSGHIALDPVLELDRGRGRRWWSLVDTLRQALDEPAGLLSTPMVARPLVDTVLRGLLVVAGEERDPGRDRAHPATLRAATDFIREHGAEPLTVSDVAAAASCGARALQEAFRRHLDTTPMLFLREVRLDRARADLVAADPDETTVSDVCWRWGFTHPGRFSAAYHRRHGEHPSHTLRS